MDFVPVRSSNIEAIGYDAANQTLGVRFKDGDEYHYFGVPEEIYNGLLSTSSVGKFLSESVKKAGYRYQQVR